MTRRSSFKHLFVEFIPSELSEGTLYVSITYSTAVHRCACGCGLKVVTPIQKAQWHLLFDGDSVTLTPSIGSWQFPCRSHYWIRNDAIVWAAPWTAKEIAAGRHHDSLERERYYAQRQEAMGIKPTDRPREGWKRPGVAAIWRKATRWMRRHSV